MSMNAAEYCQPFALALDRRVFSTKRASMVLLPFLNPNCSEPIIPLSSAIAVILLLIRAVISLSMLDGTVIGRYCDGWRESPP